MMELKLEVVQELVLPHEPELLQEQKVVVVMEEEVEKEQQPGLELLQEPSETSSDATHEIYHAPRRIFL